MRILHKKIVNIQNLEGFWINMSLIFQLLGTKLYSWFFAVFFSIPGTVRRTNGISNKVLCYNNSASQRQNDVTNKNINEVSI